MKLQKIESSESTCSAISVKGDNGYPIGLILCSQEFIPADGVELSYKDMKHIMTIMENFSLFYSNCSKTIN